MGNGGDHRAEIEELRRQLSAKDALLAARTAELASAKTGLIAKTLEAEKLKAQIAKLRRLKFGASSERIEREIEQFELALEEVKAATAEITAATALTNEVEAPDTRPVPDGSATAHKKKRRQLQPNCRAATSCMRRPTRAKPAAAPSCAGSARA